jgi:hypothetical protein
MKVNYVRIAFGVWRKSDLTGKTKAVMKLDGSQPFKKLPVLNCIDQDLIMQLSNKGHDQL